MGPSRLNPRRDTPVELTGPTALFRHFDSWHDCPAVTSLTFHSRSSQEEEAEAGKVASHGFRVHHPLAAPTALWLPSTEKSCVDRETLLRQRKVASTERSCVDREKLCRQREVMSTERSYVDRQKLCRQREVMSTERSCFDSEIRSDREKFEPSATAPIPPSVAMNASTLEAALYKGTVHGGVCLCPHCTTAPSRLNCPSLSLCSVVWWWGVGGWRAGTHKHTCTHTCTHIHTHTHSYTPWGMWLNRRYSLPFIVYFWTWTNKTWLQADPYRKGFFVCVLVYGFGSVSRAQKNNLFSLAIEVSLLSKQTRVAVIIIYLQQCNE